MPLLPGLLWPGAVAPDMVLSIGLIELFDFKQTNDICYIELLEIELFDIYLYVNNWLFNLIVSDT